MFKKILIANRGEIACRVMDTAQAMGIACVAVYSDADRNARHVRMADEAVPIGPAAARESYLCGDKIIAAALHTGAEAIHPGYGFLSENEDFAAACAGAGLVFIGPDAESIAAMGLKDRAKALMQKAGVPIVPGYMGADQAAVTLEKEAARIGYPVLIKAVAGGGGKGMRRVDDAKDFAEALKSCKREAAASFGNDHVMIEKYIEKPRHVEVQVFGDAHGNAVYLHERDCSLQRRHQKVVEEAPAPGLPDKVRKKLGAAAVQAVKAIGYKNAGTIEFIMDSKTHDFYFMEMNTRLQVEHPVTEMITGLDLVEWQLRVAAGEHLPLAQDDIPCTGHAVEVRLYAEDPANQFLPQTGRVSCFIPPADARTDSAVEEDDHVTIHYDPMIAKIITHADTRADALAAMGAALDETILSGLVTNQEFLGNIIRHPDFIAGDVDTGFIARHESALIPDDYGMADEADLLSAAGILSAGEAVDGDLWASGDNWRLNGSFSKTVIFVNRGQVRTVQLGGATHDLGTIDASFVEDDDGMTIFRNGKVMHLHIPNIEGADESGGEGRIIAPMPGKIITVMVGQGEQVTKNQPLIVMEAMKMELTIRAGCDGVIEELNVCDGQQVGDGTLLVSIGEAA